MKTIRRLLPRSSATVLCLGTVLLWALSAPAQNLLVAEEYYNRIVEITKDGTRSTFATDMWQVYWLAYDNSGDLFASLVGGIVKITPDGGQSYFSYDQLYGLAFNSAGALFGADYNAGNIYQYSPAGVRTTFASGVRWPAGLAFNSAGDLFVASQAGYIYQYSPEGVRTTFAAGLSGPAGLAFNSAGDLFVANSGNGTIIKITPGGVQSTFASGMTSNFGGPEGLAFNSSGHLFVSVRGTGYIYEYTPDGTQFTFASGLGAPNGIAFEPVPEPSSLGLLALGAAALFLRCPRKN